MIASHYYIPSESMMPLLEVGDHVIVYKRAYVDSEAQRGDVVVFEDVQGLGILLVKRLIAREGDFVEMKSGRLRINGEWATYEYMSQEDDVLTYRECFQKQCRKILRQERALGFDEDLSFVVPEGHYFMLGDNRDNSADSRYWGFVPRSYIVGKGARVLWNMRREFDSLGRGDLSRMGQKL